MGGSSSTRTSRVEIPEGVIGELPVHFGDVEFESNHFAQGACRLAYKGRLFQLQSGTITLGARSFLQGWGRDSQQSYPCVVKVFKNEAVKHPDTRSVWKKDVEQLQLAIQYAKSFNETVNANKKVVFASPLIAKVEKRGLTWFLFFSWYNDDREVGEYVFVEPFLSGEWDKFLSNNGYVNIEQNAKLAIAFAHFSHHHSNGAICITDLQGIRNDSDGHYVLTDPAVQSKKPGTYGPTDLGEKGMQFFFQSHECNEFCSQFPLPNYPPLCQLPKWYGKKGTTYTWQLSDDHI